ncbi:hypothetical protein B0H66DRAFT_556851 [Apodospora peruviana]|uniref:Sodium/calcium exchanger membrane region domain-containing protein n=1 Tax=Apodospora peruviana TaxID=516989 RepID=A0AAE0I660_9PEZI|nr:hypothetical protein B0H66DRAFT_556851 [Apodospora peruviana]
MAFQDNGPARGVGEKSRFTSSGRSETGRRSGDILPVHQGDMNNISTATTPDINSNDVDGNPNRGRGGRLGRLAVRPEGQSGRNGFHPFKFLAITFRSASWASRVVNILWPLVPAAIVVRYTLPDNYLAIWILSYLAMIPCANLVGFAGQELARKAPHVLGVLTEITLGSIVEIVLFTVMITRTNTDDVDYIQVIQAAILGSVLATMLLCLGLCFIAAGIKRDETHFSEVVSEAGNGLLLTAGFGLAIPTIFKHSLSSAIDSKMLEDKVVSISRSTAVLLMVAYFVFVYFQARTHHGIYDSVFEEDTERDEDKRRDHHQRRLTLTECIVGLAISIALVTIISISLVDQIPVLVRERHISDSFVGLILIPVVEKAAEHLTAVDEAWDNQMNFALTHVLGATLQTAMFNGPLVVIIGWGLDKDMNLGFEVFDLAMLILAIITVGQFLRDQKSNYLEGILCVLVYVGIAVAASYYPSPHERLDHATAGTGSSGGEGGGH